MPFLNSSYHGRFGNWVLEVRAHLGAILFCIFSMTSIDGNAVVRCEQPGDMTGINLVSPPENLPMRREQLILQPKESGDHQGFGIGLSLRPPLLAVGQGNNPISERGKVELYKLDRERFEIIESIDPPNPGPWDRFFKVALTDNFLAIGDSQWCPDDSSCDRGQIHLYHRPGDEKEDWKPVNIIEGPERFSGFGRTQAFDGRRLAFFSGVPDEGTRDRVSRGSVLIYEHEASNPEEWKMTARLRIPDSLSKNFAMQGVVGAVDDQVFIGATEDDGNFDVPNNQAWLHWTLDQESGEWIESEPVMVPSTCRMQYSYDGDTLVFSWLYESKGETTTSLVFFERTGTKWERVFELDTTENLTYLSIDADRLIVKAVNEDAIGYVIGRKPDGSWAFMEKLVSDSPLAVRDSGRVDFNRGIAAIVAESSGPAQFEYRGTVFIYDVVGFSINPGLNDAWYNPVTNGQGFLITVLPEIQSMFVAWFTFDTERPPPGTASGVGEPGHRWLIAQGPYSGDTATMKIYVSEGGVFDSVSPTASTDPAGDGTLIIEFADCSNAIVTYDITSAGLSGEIPIERIANDNVSLCETLAGQ